ncbi:heat-inducible transcriptional repressor HrcA [Fictibacillus iocasae]|uniref:Heat-inducible transcription repressor HrcA n=1 Tax=Fictibacillus iocasae TaxID=2715437 RepID=A0ABW2NTE2_9BACL
MLTDRQLFILQVLIDDYILHVEPVGSRTISKRDDVSFSPATIRNELADLEELGFIEKTHTSSGRIPSEKGYRFYVDHLLPKSPMRREDLERLQSMFTDKVEETEKLFDESARILSELTNYTAVILGPQAYDMTLRHLQIVPITGNMAVAIFITNTGHVENRHIMLPDAVEPGDLEKLVNILNERLAGVPLVELDQRLKSEISSVLRSHVNSYEKMQDALSKMLQWSKKDKLFFGGKTNILSQPEFKDIEKVRAVLEMLETKDLIRHLVSEQSDGITVKIGRENELEAAQNCSIINASYSVHGKHLGSISLIGPTRMDYKRVITMLDMLSSEISARLTNRFSQW